MPSFADCLSDSEEESGVQSPTGHQACPVIHLDGDGDRGAHLEPCPDSERQAGAKKRRAAQTSCADEAQRKQAKKKERSFKLEPLPHDISARDCTCVWVTPVSSKANEQPAAVPVPLFPT